VGRFTFGRKQHITETSLRTGPKSANNTFPNSKKVYSKEEAKETLLTKDQSHKALWIILIGECPNCNETK
jgi:hypothetical protein